MQLRGDRYARRMASFTVAPRSFPPGETAVSRRAVGIQRFSSASLIIDLSQWTSASTSQVEIALEFSNNDGVTWTSIASGVINYNGPDWPTPHGISDPRAIMTRQFEDITTNGRTPKERNLTTLRARVIVTGAAVSLGATLEAV